MWTSYYRCTIRFWIVAFALWLVAIVSSKITLWRLVFAKYVFVVSSNPVTPLKPIKKYLQTLGYTILEQDLK